MASQLLTSQHATSAIEDSGVALRPESFPATWIRGTDCGSDPPLQVHRYSEQLVIMRQSMCLDFEGPFVYLLLGSRAALLIDTGAHGDPPLAETVYGLVEAHKAKHGLTDYKLVVGHTHAHGDHIANDAQFADGPDTTIVEKTQDAVKAFYGLATWPDGTGALDLGDRVLQILPTPGHHSTHITVYDPGTRILFTGDTFYPGFLFISDFALYQASISRLVAFSEHNPVRWLLGTHIEMTSTPGVAYPYGTTVQPDERPLQLTRAQLLELEAALAAMAEAPQASVHDDFIITP